jgi:hypothetical protein
MSDVDFENGIETKSPIINTHRTVPWIIRKPIQLGIVKTESAASTLVLIIILVFFVLALVLQFLSYTSLEFVRSSSERPFPILDELKPQNP